MQEKKGRMIFAYVILALLIIALFARLFNLQVINGEEYYKQSRKRVSAVVTEKAPRGEIMDRNGKLLVSNREGYSVLLQKTLCSSSELNKKMLGILNVLDKYGYEYKDSLPISFAPYEFIFSDDNKDGSVEDEREKWFSERKKITKDMTAAEIIECYCKNVFNITDDYSENDKRRLVGI